MARAKAQLVKELAQGEAAEPEAEPVRLIRCSGCGREKPAPAVPGRERFETDREGNVVINEFCPHCGKGEPLAATGQAALSKAR